MIRKNFFDILLKHFRKIRKEEGNRKKKTESRKNSEKILDFQILFKKKTIVY